MAKLELNKKLELILRERGFNLYDWPRGQDPNVKEGCWVLQVAFPNGYSVLLTFIPQGEIFTATFLEKNPKIKDFQKLQESVAPPVRTTNAAAILKAIMEVSSFKDSRHKDYVVIVSEGHDGSNNSPGDGPAPEFSFEIFLDELK